MRFLTLLLSLASLCGLAGCSSPDSRITDRQAAFDQFPAATQQKIRAGEVDVGYTSEMVVMALGEPSRTFTRKTSAGDTEVWSYMSKAPRVSFGLGVGSGGGGSGVGGGVGVSTGGREPGEKMRVEIRGGVVTAVDYFDAKKK